MKKIPHVILAVILLSVAAIGQTNPFEYFKKALKEERGGFSGNKEKLSGVFAEERKRLGDRFETELWTYLGNDADKHYWVSFFVASKSYLHGNSPLPELAFKIRSRAVELLKDRNDESNLGRKVTMYRMLAVSAKLMEKQDEAVRFHEAAESILQKGKEIGAYLGARSQYDICVYDNIAGSIGNCKEADVPKERIINSGWLNSRAVILAEPVYPSELKNKGSKAQVDVRILIDTSGNVISAEIIRGPAEFHKAAIDAALRSKFSPMTLSGQPAKVSGWLSFVFKP
ncbi:MAG: energy transducer TonB [Pyrinomonadaceae bacterium]